MERSDRSSELMDVPISSEMEMNELANEFELPICSEIHENELFENAMNGQWEKVVEAYKHKPTIREAKITKSGDTALHIAVADGKTKIVLELVETIERNPLNTLKIENEKGNTALHLAAALGNVKMCNCMAKIDPQLVAARNKEGETPLFLSVLHGKSTAFRYLYSLNDDISLCRKRNEGDTILHSAISGEYFRLAFQIILYYPDLVNSVNENGQTPLHILASKPNAFKSSCRFGLFDRIIYHCIFVDLLKEAEDDHENGSNIDDSQTKSDLNYPANYEACVKFFNFIKTSIRVLSSTKSLCQADDEENPSQKCIISEGDTIMGSSSQSHARESAESKSKDGTIGTSDVKKRSIEEHHELYPPNYGTCVGFFKLMYHVLLVVLGVGIWRINYIIEKKVRHICANKIMNELVEHTTTYQNENTGRNPRKSRYQNQEDDFSVNSETPPNPDDDERFDCSSSTSNPNMNGNGSVQSTRKKMEKPILLAAKFGATEMLDRFLESYPAAVQELNTSQKNLVLLTFDKKKAEQSGRKETPILIAAKMGLTEMVEKILDKFPVAIQDLDSDNKNVVLLAVENRQTRMFKLLLERKTVSERVFRQVDNEGNSALHLAAMFGEYRPWLIPGGALQMQWEIKWYEYVKKSMPRHFFVRHNNKGKTPKEIFTETHKDLIKDGSEWLTKTSESCSVVAALIATVAFATSTTVPGGVHEDSGKPILENDPVFDLFAISSLVALCFSVTALVFFLSILTSRFQEKDFAMELPRKLLLGLTTLFTSIAAILISFCAGHSFVIRDQIRSVAYPIYAATCLPMTFFALAQLPLYFDLMKAILKKVPQRSYKVIPH